MQMKKKIFFKLFERGRMHSAASGTVLLFNHICTGMKPPA